MNLSNNQLVIIVVISIFFIIFNYYTNGFIEGLTNAEKRLASLQQQYENIDNKIISLENSKTHPKARRAKQMQIRSMKKALTNLKKSIVRAEVAVNKDKLLKEKEEERLRKEEEERLRKEEEERLRKGEEERLRKEEEERLRKGEEERLRKEEEERLRREEEDRIRKEEERQQMLSKIKKQQEEREKSLKNYSNIRDNYNIRYHLTEKTLRRKFPVLLKEDNISFQKDGKTQEIKRLPAQNRVTYFEPGEKHFVSNYVPNYEERIILSKKRNELNFNETSNI
jgi:hypothetical protein